VPPDERRVAIGSLLEVEIGLLKEPLRGATIPVQFVSDVDQSIRDAVEQDGIRSKELKRAFNCGR
jgi:hypothetical protein